MGLKILILSVKERANELFLLVFSLIMAMCIFGGLIICAEMHTDQYPDVEVSLWWALITISAVGYDRSSRKSYWITVCNQLGS